MLKISLRNNSVGLRRVIIHEHFRTAKQHESIVNNMQSKITLYYDMHVLAKYRILSLLTQEKC